MSNYNSSMQFLLDRAIKDRFELIDDYDKKRTEFSHYKNRKTEGLIRRLSINVEHIRDLMRNNK